MTDHHAFMRRAYTLACESLEEGSVPVGSVIVLAGAIVGEGRNISAQSGNMRDHAEIRALDDALRRTGLTSFKDSGAVCYSTLESCPMCLWSMHLMGIETVVLGATFAGIGRTDFGGYSIEAMSALTTRKMAVVHGVMTEESSALAKAYKPH
ncbi:MAG: nucleoside deaminase [Bauldia sp.]